MGGRIAATPMPSRLHPSARAVLQELAALGGRRLPEGENGEALDAARRAYVEQGRRLGGEVEPVARCSDIAVPAPAGAVAVRLYEPAPGTGRGVVLYLHGGGFVLGSPASHDAVVRALCNATDAVVASVDYRLAPEHRFPAAVEDAWAALRWAHEHARDFGADGSRLAVVGDSAGGNLAAVLTRRARDAGGPPVRLQALAYPVLDAAMDTPSFAVYGAGYGLDREDMETFWRMYLGEDGDPADPEASPLRSASLEGLAPAFVLTAECDPLRDEGERYAQRLAAAGGAGVRVCHRGMPHGFLRWRARTGAAVRALEELSEAVRVALL
jgi:acetyl esterase